MKLRNVPFGTPMVLTVDGKTPDEGGNINTEAKGGIAATKVPTLAAQTDTVLAVDTFPGVSGGNAQAGAFGGGVFVYTDRPGDKVTSVGQIHFTADGGETWGATDPGYKVGARVIEYDKANSRFLLGTPAVEGGSALCGKIHSLSFNDGIPTCSLLTELETDAVYGFAFGANKTIAVGWPHGHGGNPSTRDTVGIFTTTDGGNTWNLIDPAGWPDAVENQTTVYLTAAVSNGNRRFVCGRSITDINAMPNASLLYWSDDGETWQACTGFGPEKYSAYTNKALRVKAIRYANGIYVATLMSIDSTKHPTGVLLVSTDGKSFHEVDIPIISSDVVFSDGVWYSLAVNSEVAVLCSADNWDTFQQIRLKSKDGKIWSAFYASADNDGMVLGVPYESGRGLRMCLNVRALARYEAAKMLTIRKAYHPESV